MSRREALAALARRYPEEYRRIYAALKDGRPVDEVTVTEWAEQWLTMRERIVRPGSLSADKAAVTKWIIPTVGARPLAGLQRSDIRAVHASAETAGLAASSVSRIHVVTMKMLGDAVDEGHDVPERTRRTPSPAVGVSGRQALTVDAARAVLRVAMLGRGVFGAGAVISATAFVQAAVKADGYKGVYFRLVDSREKERDLHLSVLSTRGGALK